MTLSLSPKTWSHLQQLSLVFQRLTEAGLKAKLTKCEFLKSRIEFLEHLVDGFGIRRVDSKINALQKFPAPKSVENVRSFLGLAGYYRAFDKNFASIASPLTPLFKKDVPFLWNDAQQQFHYSKSCFYSCTNSCVPRLQIAFYHVHGRFCPSYRCCSHPDRI